MEWSRVDDKVLGWEEFQCFILEKVGCWESGMIIKKI